jgi:hypothetical protein
VWNESFEIENVEMDKNVKFLCYEDDLTSSDFIGDAQKRVS